MLCAIYNFAASYVVSLKAPKTSGKTMTYKSFRCFAPPSISQPVSWYLCSLPPIKTMETLSPLVIPLTSHSRPDWYTSTGVTRHTNSSEGSALMIPPQLIPLWSSYYLICFPVLHVSVSSIEFRLRFVVLFSFLIRVLSREL